MNQHVGKPKGETPTKLGRPTKYDPSRNGEVQALCKMGATLDEVAEHLSIDDLTVSRWMLIHPEFNRAMKIGREAADNRVVRALYQKALKGDAWAIGKWLKNRMGAEWGESEPIVVSNTTVIDARRIVLEQLSDDQLRTIEALETLAISGPSVSEADPVGSGSSEGEIEP